MSLVRPLVCRRCRGRLRRWHHWLDPSDSSAHKPAWTGCLFCPEKPIGAVKVKTFNMKTLKWIDVTFRERRRPVLNQPTRLRNPSPLSELTTMFLGRLMRSAMVLISLKAFSMARSELLMVRRFWYFELPNSSKLAAPVPCGGNAFNASTETRDSHIGPQWGADGRWQSGRERSASIETPQLLVRILANTNFFV